LFLTAKQTVDGKRQTVSVRSSTTKLGAEWPGLDQAAV
jgi:hypothetical protein